MKRLIVVRNGQYKGSGTDEALTSIGQRQIWTVANRFADIELGRTGIFTSPAPPAQECADIIAGFLVERVTIVDCLDYEARQRATEFPETLDLVRGIADDHDTVILVTHFGVACSFLQYYARAVLNHDYDEFMLLHEGAARLLRVDSGGGLSDI